jgi:hypothetical protein
VLFVFCTRKAGAVHRIRGARGMLLRQRQHERRLEGKTRLVAAETKGAARSASGRAFKWRAAAKRQRKLHMLRRAAARRHTAAQLLLAADEPPFRARR